MPEDDSGTTAKRFFPDTPQVQFSHVIRGANNVDWGMQNRLSHIVQSADPLAMLGAVRAIVHGGASANEAFELYQDAEDPR